MSANKKAKVETPSQRPAVKLIPGRYDQQRHGIKKWVHLISIRGKVNDSATGFDFPNFDTSGSLFFIDENVVLNSRREILSYDGTTLKWVKVGLYTSGLPYSEPTSKEKWNIIDDPKGGVRIQNVSSGKYLTVKYNVGGPVIIMSRAYSWDSSSYQTWFIREE